MRTLYFNIRHVMTETPPLHMIWHHSYNSTVTKLCNQAGRQTDACADEGFMKLRML